MSTGCRPYTIAPCEHHVNGSRPPCTGEGGDTPECVAVCEPGYTPSYKQDKRLGKNVGRPLELHLFHMNFATLFHSVDASRPRKCTTSRCVAGKTSYSVLSDSEQIQLEIFKNGPVEGAFIVYEDFPLYKSG